MARFCSIASRSCVVVAVGASLLGCSAKVTAQAEARSEEVIVRVTTIPLAKVSAVGVEVAAVGDGKAELHIPADKLPLGPQSLTIDVVAEGSGRTGQATVSFDRAKVPTRLEVAGYRDKGIGFHCPAMPCAESELFAKPDGGMLFRWKAPPGSVLRVFDQASRPSNAPEQEMTVDVSQKVLALDVGLFSLVPHPPPPPERSTIEIPFRLETHDGDVREEKVVVTVESTWWLREALANVASTPVRFGKDPRHEGKSRIVFRARTKRFIGAGTLADLDLVALETITRKKKVKSCGAYIVGGPRISVVSDDIYTADDEVSVYERRTGKLVATQSFSGTSPCPEELPQKEPPKQDALIDAWLASLP